MKKVLFFVMLLLGVVACTKEDVSVSETKLKISVLDSEGVSEPNVKVFLYDNMEDLIAEDNVIDSATTDAKGEVVFGGLDAQKYYWKVETDCRVNDYMDLEKYNSLSLGKINHVNSILIDKKNSLTISNEFSETYSIYIDDVFHSDINSNESEYIVLDNGEYDITLKEKDYLLSQNIVKKTVLITCGEEKTITFN